MYAFQSVPHPALGNHIAQYLFLSLDNTNELNNLKQTFFPLDICGLAFFSKKLHIHHPKTKINNTVATVYTGLITEPCSLTFHENEKVEGFIISFKPFGFSDLFKINNSEVTDYFPDFLTIRAKEGQTLYEQIMDAKNISEKIQLADSYFLKKLPRNDNSVQIREACHQIMLYNGLINIKTVAAYTNMSLSCLERNFYKKVGVSPKLFSRFKRFQFAASLLNSSDHSSFSSIAYQSGYYDQAHFIKEFEAFTGLSPSKFSIHNFPLYNQLILNRSYYTFRK